MYKNKSELLGVFTLKDELLKKPEEGEGETDHCCSVFEVKGVWFRGSGAHAEGRAVVLGGVAPQDCSKWKSHLLESLSKHSTVHVPLRRLAHVRENYASTSALDLDGMRLKLRTCSRGTTGRLV